MTAQDQDRLKEVDHDIEVAKNDLEDLEHPYNGDDVIRYDDVDNEDDDPSRAGGHAQRS